MASTFFYSRVRAAFAGLGVVCALWSLPCVRAADGEPQQASAIASGEGTVPAPASPDPAELVRRLGDPDYYVREDAQRQLIEMGIAARPFLREALQSDDLEIATRAEYILQRLKVEWVKPTDPPEVQRLMAAYGQMELTRRLEIIGQLAGLPEYRGLPALARIACYESDEEIAFAAAYEVFYRRPEGRRDLATYLTAMGELPAVQGDLPAAAVAAFQRLHTDDQGIAFAEEVLERFRENAGRLTGDGARVEMLLLYETAEQLLKAGRDADAEHYAAEARSRMGTIDNEALEAHLTVGYKLRARGLTDWAAGEFELLCDSDELLAGRFGCSALAEMWHDQGLDAKAAEAVEAYFAKFGDDVENLQFGRDELFRELQARGRYFLACRYAAEGDTEKQLAALRRALEIYPYEIDTLIALYRLSEGRPRLRQEAIDKIAAAVDRYRGDIESNPKSPTNYNQLAWLLANTDDPFGEAVRLAETAVELDPVASAYHDTLGRAYFSQGLLSKAIQSQARALELEPYSGLLRKQFREFVEAWRERFPGRPLPLDVEKLSPEVGEFLQSIEAPAEATS
ncbi:MAG: hypothetical protein D6741_11720 [Planctomycetota bacterium]|nr:MAG: hypothetical protein D6741_11720 [Planctomycetota bacterium]